MSGYTATFTIVVTIDGNSITVPLWPSVEETGVVIGDNLNEIFFSAKQMVEEKIKDSTSVWESIEGWLKKQVQMFRLCDCFSNQGECPYESLSERDKHCIAFDWREKKIFRSAVVDVEICVGTPCTSPNRKLSEEVKDFHR